MESIFTLRGTALLFVMAVLVYATRLCTALNVSLKPKAKGRLLGIDLIAVFLLMTIHLITVNVNF